MGSKKINLKCDKKMLKKLFKKWEKNLNFKTQKILFSIFIKIFQLCKNLNSRFTIEKQFDLSTKCLSASTKNYNANKLFTIFGIKITSIMTRHICAIIYSCMNHFEGHQKVCRLLITFTIVFIVQYFEMLITHCGHIKFVCYLLFEFRLKMFWNCSY